MQGDSGLPDPLLGGHVPGFGLFLELAAGLRAEGQGRGALVGTQEPEQLLLLGAQDPAPPPVYLGKNGSTWGGCGKSQR